MAKFNPVARALEDTPVDGHTRKGATSNWAYDHSAAKTDVHEAGTDNLDTDAARDAAITTHTADLDAHTRDHYMALRTGEYLPPTPIAPRGSTDTAIVANELYAVPFPVVRAMTLDRLILWVKVASGTSGSVVRLGIYNDGVNLYPGTLLLDAGTVDGNSATIQSVTINQALTKGLYWLALLADVGCSVRGTCPPLPWLGVHPSDLTSPLSDWNVAQAYGALPSPFPTGGTNLDRKDIIIAYRIASLN